MKYEDIVVQPIKNHSYRVKKDIIYNDIMIPEGYVTNGADVPRLFWAFFPPNKSDYLPAVIVHDYLCDKEEYKKADLYFKNILEELKISRIQINCLYYTVRLYHIVRYDILKIK